MSGGKFEAYSHDENDQFYCEACNRSWKTTEELQKHVSEHEVCGREGCTFTAHPKIVALHVQFHHYTGMYKKIANVQSPEDIAKWIAERKSRYPTDANIAVRIAKEKEMIERGERVEENKTDRNNRQKRGEQKSNRLNWREKRTRRDQAMVESKPVRKRSEVVSDEEEGESPKKDWNGNLPPFQGLSCFSSVDKVDANVKIEENPSAPDISDHSINSISSDSKEDVCSAALLPDSTDVASENIQEDKSSNEDKPTSKSAGNLSANSSSQHSVVITSNVTSGHNSVDDAEPDKTASVQTPISRFNSPCDVKLRLVPYDIDVNEESEDSGPEECQFIKTNEENVNPPSEVSLEKIPETCNLQTTINSSETNDSVKNPKSRKRQRHRSSLDKGKDSEQDTEKKETYVKKKKLTLLEKLLSKEIQHERNVILQCVHYVVSNNFFNDDKMPTLWNDDTDSDCSTD